MDCFVAHAPWRKRLAFVAGNDELRTQISTTSTVPVPLIKRIIGGIIRGVD